MQQQGGSQYGLPPSEMAPFSPFTVRPRAHLLGIPGPDHLQQPPLAEAASPISSRPPAASAPRPPAMNFDELAPAVASGNFPDDEALAAGEEAERGSGATGNRWPRQETLVLLKIRSVMDAAFREATLKGPLWEEVSRKLAELGYKRSAKKCKEKFENVHKYYKRTKEGRAGRQDGKSYRFFSQLEALHSGSAATATTAAALVASSSSLNPGMAGPPPSRVQPISAVAPQTMAMPTRVVVPELTPPGGPQGISSSAACGISFSSKSSSSSSEADDEVTEEAGERQEGRKRKISGGDVGTNRKMMAFFDRLMKQVVERQEAMQQRFLEAIEKREQDRMIRDEAWRRQEMARLNWEQELLAQERAIALSRDAAIISYLQKISGQTIPIPTMPATPIATSPLPQQQPPHAPPPPPPAAQQQPQPPLPQQQKPPASAQPTPQQHEVQKHHQSTEIVPHQPSSGSTELVPGSEPLDAGGSASLQEPMSSSSRWPKSEVHALIKLRSELESKFQEIGPKGLLWEEISAGMQRLGYSRSAKRCKEKWENINKYFKKVKESNRKRPEDSKTCPYFAQLDALYRNKLIGAGAGGGSSSGSGSTVGIQRQHGQETNPASSQQQSDVLTIMSPPPPVQQQPATEAESKNGKSSSENNRNGGNSEDGGVSGSTQVQTSNGGLSPSFFDVGLKKPEDIVKELMDEAVTDDYDKLDEAESDNMDQDDEDEDDDDEEAGKMQYKIQIQSQNVNAGGSGGNSSAAAATAGSFFAIVQ